MNLFEKVNLKNVIRYIFIFTICFSLLCISGVLLLDMYNHYDDIDKKISNINENVSKIREEISETKSEILNTNEEINNLEDTLLNNYVAETKENIETEKIESEITSQNTQNDTEGVLTAYKGVNYNSSGNKETYYNLNMEVIVSNAQNNGIQGEYWVRDDGAKMYGDYIIVAADYSTYPYGTTVETSLGTGIVLDTGEFAASNPNQIDIATVW